MWVFCCGMMRSGSTLQYQITSEIVERTNRGKRLGFLYSPDLLRRWQAEYYDADKFLVVKCHDYHDDFAQLLSGGLAKSIYIYRDIRDVVTSWMNMQQRTFEEVIRSNFVADQLENYYSWTHVDNILISRYEDLILKSEGLSDEIRRIAQHLNITLDWEFVSAIAHEHSLTAQVQRIREIDFESNGVRFGHQLFDRTSQLHYNHIESGQVEQWRDALNETQITSLENMTYDWLVDAKYPAAFVTPDNRQSIPRLVANALVDFTALDRKKLVAFTLKRQQATHRQLNAKITKLQSHITELNVILKHQEAEIRRLQQIENNWGWRFISRVHKLRSRLFREGTLLGTIHRTLRDAFLGN